MSVLTSASLGQLAVSADLISREQCQALRRYQRQRIESGRPLSFARMLLAAGVDSKQLRRLLREGAHLGAVRCDCCGEPHPQDSLTSRREYPCDCGGLVMPFRAFARRVPKRELRETHAYSQVLPLPHKEFDRLDEVLVEPIARGEEPIPTLRFRDVISLPTGPRSESETLSAFRALVEGGASDELQPTRRDSGGDQLELTRVGPFKLERRIGEGSVGTVYLGRHYKTGERAAVKVLRPETADDEEFLARFEREAEAAQRVNHPNLVRVIETGYDSDARVRYLGMEYLSRGSLGELLKHTPILLERRALEITRDVCEALVAASAAGIVHRDVKPHNVLFDREGVAKLADLGLALTLGDESRITATGVVVGTPLYIAPEQASGREVDARADLYALGLCLYEMLSGKQAFAEDGAPPIEIIVRHLKEELPDVRLANPQVSDNAAQLVRGLCAREVDQRYVTPSAALRDFTLVLDGHSPLGASNPSPASALTDPTVRVALAQGMTLEDALALERARLAELSPSPSQALSGAEAPASGKSGLALLALLGGGGLLALAGALYVILAN